MSNVVKNAEPASKPGVFRVLGSFDVALPGPWWWQTEDIDEDAAMGVIFRAYDQPEYRDMAYLIVVDVTSDPTEPQIGALSESDVAAVDEDLRKSLMALGEAGGMPPITKWMSSQLNQTPSFKALVTAYIVNDAGTERQCIALRLPFGDRKFVVMGCFDVKKADLLARPIMLALSNIHLVQGTRPA